MKADRIKEIKKENPIIYLELERLINMIASYRVIISNENNEMLISAKINKFKNDLRDDIEK